MKTQCTCNHCSGKIEFEVEDIGQPAPCPLCGMETVLFDNRPPKAEPPPKKIVKAKLIVESLEGGVEGSLEVVSTTILLIGIMGGVLILIGVFVAGTSHSIPDIAIVPGIAIGIGLIIQGWIFSVLMKTAAEIIRLLKKLNGLKFSGKIENPTEPKPVCSLCKSQQFDERECKVCGAVFEN